MLFEQTGSTLGRMMPNSELSTRECKHMKNSGMHEHCIVAACDKEAGHKTNCIAAYGRTVQGDCGYQRFWVQCIAYPYRDIVKASHLAPLERKELLDSTRNQPWNSVVHGASRKNETQGTESSSPPESSITTSRVCNIQEFTREWRRLSRLPELQQYQ